MDMPLKIWFVESGHSERKLLGRSAEEYLLREFSAFDTEKSSRRVSAALRKVGWTSSYRSICLSSPSGTSREGRNT